MRYEVFCDMAYFDQWAVRPVGVSRWGHCYHLPSKEEAEGLAKQLEELEAERDEAREAFVIATDQMAIAQGKVREANKERDEAIQRRMETILQCELYEQERDEAREIAGRLAHFLERPAYSVDEAIARMEALNSYKKQKSQ